MATKKRLIDAAALDEKLEALAKKYAAQGRNEVAKDYSFVQTVLMTAPTVDAVEVVHCGSCRFACDETTDGWMWCNNWCNGTTCDGYCHAGERKDNEKPAPRNI